MQPVDPSIEAALKHLVAQQGDLKGRIDAHSRALKEDTQELAKVEQAIVGLRPLVPLSVWEKWGPVILGVGLVLGAVASSVSSMPQALGESAGTANLIEEVVRDGGEMTDSEILDAMVSAGWQSRSDNRLGMLRSYLSRMVQSDELVRVGPSTYRIAVSTNE